MKAKLAMSAVMVRIFYVSAQGLDLPVPHGAELPISCTVDSDGKRTTRQDNLVAISEVRALLEQFKSDGYISSEAVEIGVSIVNSCFARAKGTFQNLGLIRLRLKDSERRVGDLRAAKLKFRETLDHQLALVKVKMAADKPTEVVTALIRAIALAEIDFLEVLRRQRQRG